MFSKKNNPHYYLEKTLKQIILKDLITDSLQDLFKKKTELRVKAMKSTISNLPNSDSKKIDEVVLLIAAYGLDWHDLPNLKVKKIGNKIWHKGINHTIQSCIKVERLLYQKLTSHVSEKQIIESTDLIWNYDYKNTKSYSNKLLTQDELQACLELVKEHPYLGTFIANFNDTVRF